MLAFFLHNLYLHNLYMEGGHSHDKNKSHNG